jgi:16S rRNA processing protein RimM
MSDQSVAKKNNPDNKLIMVGVISSAHGILGQVVVKSFTQPPENIVNLPVFDQDQNAIKLKMMRLQPNGNLICKLENCYTRTEAETLIKKSLYCFRSSLPEILEEDEFYIEDLQGLKVIDPQGNHIGNITNVANYGGGDIIEVQFINNEKSEMLPFTKELFPEITKHHVVLNI